MLQEKKKHEGNLDKVNTVNCSTNHNSEEIIPGKDLDWYQNPPYILQNILSIISYAICFIGVVHFVQFSLESSFSGFQKIILSSSFKSIFKESFRVLLWLDKDP